MADTSSDKEGWLSYVTPNGEWDRIYYVMNIQPYSTHNKNSDNKTKGFLRFYYEDTHVKEGKHIYNITATLQTFVVEVLHYKQVDRDSCFTLTWGGYGGRTPGNDKAGYLLLSSYEMNDFIHALAGVDEDEKLPTDYTIARFTDFRNVDESQLDIHINQTKSIKAKSKSFIQSDWDQLAVAEAIDGLGIVSIEGHCYHGLVEEKTPLRHRYVKGVDFALELYPPNPNEHLERHMTDLIHVVGANVYKIGLYEFDPTQRKMVQRLSTSPPGESFRDLPSHLNPNDFIRRIPQIPNNPVILYYLEQTQGKRTSHLFAFCPTRNNKRWSRFFVDCHRFVPCISDPTQNLPPFADRFVQMELNRSDEILSTIREQTEKDNLDDRLQDEIAFIIASENVQLWREVVEQLHRNINSTKQPDFTPVTLNTPTITGAIPPAHSYGEGEESPPPPPPPMESDDDLSYIDRISGGPYVHPTHRSRSMGSAPPPPPPPSSTTTNGSTSSNTPSNASSLLLSASQPEYDYISGSLRNNTKGGNMLKSAVSKKKRRFKMGTFDLDLTYITNRIIAMGFPSVGKEAVYRNNMRDVTRFFENRHPDHYKIYNLCSERLYPKSSFPRVLHFPFDDHNPPAFQDIFLCVRDICRFLRAHPDNVVGIHCKAGKGRTGLVICILMSYIGMFSDVRNSLRYYASVRTLNAKGVTISSQLLYTYMFQTYLVMAQKKYQADQQKRMSLFHNQSGGGNTSDNNYGYTSSSGGNTQRRLSSSSRSGPISPLLEERHGITAIPHEAQNCPELLHAYQELNKAEEQLNAARIAVDDIRKQQDELHAELPMELPPARWLQIHSITLRGENAPPVDYFTVFSQGVTLNSKNVKPKITRIKTSAPGSIIVPAAGPDTTANENNADDNEPIEDDDDNEDSDNDDETDRFTKSKNLYKYKTYPGDGHKDSIPPMPGPQIQYTFDEGSFPVLCDFHVEFYKSSLLGKKKLFTFWLQTQFVEMGGFKVTMNKPHLNKISKTNAKDFQCEIILKPLEKSPF